MFSNERHLVNKYLLYYVYLSKRYGHIVLSGIYSSVDPSISIKQQIVEQYAQYIAWDVSTIFEVKPSLLFYPSPSLFYTYAQLLETIISSILIDAINMVFTIALANNHQQNVVHAKPE